VDFNKTLFFHLGQIIAILLAKNFISICAELGQKTCFTVGRSLCGPLQCVKIDFYYFSLFSKIKPYVCEIAFLA
jgi:hypothetical protein